MNLLRTRFVARAAALLIVLGVGCLPAAGLPSLAQDEPETRTLALETVAANLWEPLDVVDPNDGSGRLFVLERRGVIRVIVDGEPLSEPLLDISAQVNTTDWERGALGLALHPSFTENGYLYITYTPDTREWALERYQISAGDPNRADPDSVTPIIRFFEERHYGGHYGGNLTFGPEGYLYVSIGDGGGAFDPYNHAQDLSTLMGSILRIDIDGGEPYAIPLDNPFVETPDARGEIWAYGLRNPWRFSIDPESGDLYIGDVGHVTWEEINLLPGSGQAGVNYGWPILEGFECTTDFPSCDPDDYAAPAIAYDHGTGCSIIGGYVYRGNPASALYGAYLFSDYCSGDIWTLNEDERGQWSYERLLDTGLNVSSLAVDAHGEIYVTDMTNGGLYRLIAGPVESDPIVSGVSYNVLVAGSVGCRLDVRGANFNPSSQASLNGAARATTYISATRLSVALETSDLAQAGTLELTVGNSDFAQPSSAPFSIEVSAGPGQADAIVRAWSRSDAPVATGGLGRSWLWGPNALACAFQEPYAEAPDGLRTIQYFDKARMEITNPDGDSDSEWYVANGLLVVEMVRGELQLGDRLFEKRAPAELNIAGDPDDMHGPTYAALAGLLDATPLAPSDMVTQRIDRFGTVTVDESLAQRGVVAAHYVEETNHAIAAPFWSAMSVEAGIWNAPTEAVFAPLSESPFHITGMPISEPYWTTILVMGSPQDVLVQAFERRVLTYTPDNPPGWQVETGNVGRHYFQWRYQHDPE